mgnify:CR=1 FL=1
MLKIKSILVSLLAVAALASCSNENLEENSGVEGGSSGYDVAYVSISLTNPKVPARFTCFWRTDGFACGK